MSAGKLDWSPGGWPRVYLATILGTLACIVITHAFDAPNYLTLAGEARMRALLIDTLLPLFLAAPALFLLTNKIRQLAIAHEQLTIYASTDGLTQILNRAAFSTLVDAYLTEVRAHEERAYGALLIIDADNFKSVNDRYGHDRGDEALVTIAQSIKSTLRAPDLVGRLGGEEFGVFLPGADPVQAETVAERIRKAVNDADFPPAGRPHALSVSVGGAVFDRRLPFADLFRLADQQLYVAKQNGRNRVAMSPVRPTSLPAAA
jgi:diguanylate cyclase (GGDEF)-like protein